MPHHRPDAEDDDPFGDRARTGWHEEFAPTNTRANRLAWLLVLGVGFLVFELTADPALGMLLGCFKFGWDELRLSRRMRRLDPNRVRGRVCARFYQAYALWKVSLVALGAMFVVIMIHATLVENLQPAGQPKPDAPPREFITACLIWIGGFAIAGGASMIAVVSALRNKVRVWVGRDRNRLKPVLLSVVLFWGTPLLLGLGVPLIFLLRPWNEMAAVLGFMILMMVLYPVVVLVTLERLDARIGARSPSECWPEMMLPTPSRPAFLTELGL
jgi:hypothetical protein